MPKRLHRPKVRTHRGSGDVRETYPFGFGEGDAEGRGRFVYMNVPDLPYGPGLSEVAAAIHRRLAQTRAITALLGGCPRRAGVALSDEQYQNNQHAVVCAGDLLDQVGELVEEMLRMGTEAEEDALKAQEANHE